MSKPLMTFRKHFDYDAQGASDDSAYVETMPSLTVQSQAEEADINVLMMRYGITGKMPENPRVPTYGDFTGISNYQDALNAVMAADNDFMALPADVRARFQNDPQMLLEFVSNDANIEEARKLGLMKPLTPIQLKEIEDRARANQDAGKSNQAAAVGAGEVGKAAAGSAAAK